MKRRFISVFVMLLGVMAMGLAGNGAPRSVFWGSLLSSVAGRARHIELSRLYEDRLTPVKLDPRDPSALLLPLLPGDHLNWE